MAVALYGISQCDSVKKARRWLDANSIEYVFHDYKKLGIDAESLRTWCDVFGWESVANKRGTTWRKLDLELRETLTEDGAIKLMQEHTSLIKRPIVNTGEQWLLGFNEAQFSEALLNGQ